MQVTKNSFVHNWKTSILLSSITCQEIDCIQYTQENIVFHPEKYLRDDKVPNKENLPMKLKWLHITADPLLHVGWDIASRE